MFLEDVSFLTKGSHAVVNTSCDFCGKEKKIPYKDAYYTCSKNGGKLICLKCSRNIKYSGRNNPNCKYNLDDNFFSKIDTEEKAYLLGWIASDGHIRKAGFCISIRKKDINILSSLRDIISKDLVIKQRIGYKNKNYKSIDEITDVTLTVNSKQISKDLCGLLKINPGKKSAIVQFPEIDKELEKHFIRGYFDGDGSICNPRKSSRQPRCKISSNSLQMLKSIQEKCIGKANIYRNNEIEWNGNNCIDFLSYIYDDSKIKLERKYDLYLLWNSWIPSIGGVKRKDDVNTCELQWSKCKKNAISLTKNRGSDSGYDISIIDIVKKTEHYTLYGTGIKVKPEYGWWLQLTPRSSIIKSGHMMVNSVGVIDRTFVGEILICLTKIDNNVPDLELPYKIAQLIPIPIINFQIIEVDSFEDTNRSEKGFGSSDIKKV